MPRIREEFNLDDQELREDQIRKRETSSKPEDKSCKTIMVGDTVTVANTHDKHKAKDVYLVTENNNMRS